MKKLRKILKLLPPAFLMRSWLQHRYGITVPPAPWKGIASWLLDLAPYALTAALSCRKDSDCRLLKYYLPYGRMKKFVRMMYGIPVGNDARDSGFIGALRSVMPYGLVLWWDAEDERLAAPVRSPRRAAISATGNDSESSRMPDSKRQELERLDRLEVMMLRIIIGRMGK